MIRVKALKAFLGPDGNRKKDDVFEVPADRANWLANEGFVQRVDKAEPAAKAAPAKAEKKAE